MNLLKNLILVFIFCAFSKLNAQIGYTHTYESWSRFNMIQTTDNMQINGQVDHRFNYLKGTGFIQMRVLAMSSPAEDKIQYGIGITARPDEFRFFQAVSYDCHRIWLEERIYYNETLWRLRYMIYPRININEKSYLNSGVELMIQGPLGQRFYPEQTRIMLDYTRLLKNNNRLSIGYMSRISNNTITHIVRLTFTLNYENFGAKE